MCVDDIRVEPLEVGTSVTAPSDTSAATFYQVDYEGQTAWLANNPFLRVDGDTSAIPVIE